MTNTFIPETSTGGNQPSSPQRVEVYCDESRHDLISSAYPRSGKAVIGSLWIDESFRDTFKSDFSALRQHFNVRGEVKWSKTSPSRLGFYESLIHYFFTRNELKFRAIVIDAKQLDIRRFHDSDEEAFYKFYYQLLHHWLEPGATYRIFCDFKINQDPQRLPLLRTILQNANRASTIEGLFALDSRESAGVQLCDYLTGVTQRAFNPPATLSTKDRIVEKVEAALGRSIGPSSSSEKKFNVFKIRLQG